MTAFKIMLLGEIGVGKTSLVRRLVHDKFDESYMATIAVDISSYAIRGGGADGRLDIDLIIWDTDGTFGSSIFKHAYIRGAAGALIVGDIARPATLTEMAKLARGFEEELPGRDFALVLNKLDLLATPEQAGIPTELLTFGRPIRSTSAKTGTHVKDAFVDLGAAIIRRGF